MVETITDEADAQLIRIGIAALVFVVSPIFMGEVIHTFTDGDIVALIQHRKNEGYSVNTIHAHLNVLRGAINHAEKLQYLVNEKLKYEPIKIPNKPINYLTDDEQQRLIKQLQPTDLTKPQSLIRWECHDKVITILDLGLRISEVVSLEWSAVDLNKGTIRVFSHKVQKESVLHLSNRLIEVLTRRKAVSKSAWVFPNKTNDGPCSFDRSILKRAATRAGIKDFESWHQLRRTFATRLVQVGVPIYDISKLLHHSNISTTLKYAALSTTDASTKAVNVLNQLNG